MQEIFDSGGVYGALHRPERANGGAIALTHGAGSSSNAPLLVRLASTFADAGYLVLRFDLPFRRERPKGPPYPAGAERDREGITRAIAAVRGLATGGRVFVGGHSYGGRQTAMTAAAQPELADALLLLSYPLHPPGRPDQKRTAYFPELRTPALFVHGARDPFGSLEEMREAIALIPARTGLVEVAGAGHELKGAANLAESLLERLRALV